MRVFFGLYLLIFSHISVVGVVFNDPIFVSTEHVIVNGYSTYSIGDGPHADYFPVSVLNFPVNDDVHGITVSSKTENYQLTAKLGYGYTGNAGVLKDYDYGVSIESNEVVILESTADLGIYSESPLSQKTFYMCMEYLYLVGNRLVNDINVAFFFGGSLTYHYLEYRTFKTVQTYPATNESDDVVLRNAVNYDIRYTIPKLTFHVEGEMEKWRVYTQLSVIPYLYTTDRDDHLLRGKVSKADSEGAGMEYKVGVTYAIQPKLTLGLKYCFLTLEGRGEQVQTFSNSDTVYRIDYELETQEQWVGLEFKYAI